MKFQNSEFARLEDTKKVPYLSFPVLSRYPFLTHGFSTRLGGVSQGMFSSMNFGCDTAPGKDSEDNILENYSRIADSIGFNVNTIVLSRQVHKTNIRMVTPEDCGKGLLLPRDYDEIDGLITNYPDITLVTKYADCVPLYFVDPVKKAIGLTHSGWRGTVARIGGHTVEAMQQQFGSNPKDIVAVIGPSICNDCFEIGEEVAIEFMQAFPASQIDAILTDHGNGKYQCDLWAANLQVLLNAGLIPSNIQISGVCTCCNNDLLFSHRKAQGKRGSLAAFLALKKDA